MASAELVQEGIRYVPSRIAAKSVGLTADYISRMCREELVAGTWHRGQWYVHEPSLQRFVEEKRRRQDELTRQQTERLRREREQAEAAARRARGLAKLQRLLRATALGAITALIAILPATYGRAAVQEFASQLPPETRAQLASATTVLNTLQDAASNFASSIIDAIGDILVPIEIAPPTVIFVRAPDATSAQAQVAAHIPQPLEGRIAPQTVADQPRDDADAQAPVRLIERVVETQRIVAEAGGLTEEILNAKLNQLDQKLLSQIYAVASVGNANSTTIVQNYNAVGGALRIDQLDDIDVNDSRWSGGSITGASVSATSLAVTGSATSTFAGGIQATYLNLTGTSATTTFASGINLAEGCFAVDGTCITGSGGSSASTTLLSDDNTFSGTTTFTEGITLSTPLAASSGGTGISSYAVGDLLYVNASGALARLGVGSTDQVLKVSGGVPAWGADAQGSSGSGAFSTSTDSLLIYPTDTADVLVLGASATSTTGNIFEVIGSSLFGGLLTAYNTVSAPTFTATSTSAASTFPFASSTAVTVSGTGYFTTASTTNLTVSNVQSSLLFAGATGSVLGTSTLSVPFGGTGSTTLSGILKGNGTGGVMTALPGTDYVANTTGDWTGTLDGLEGSFYLENSFSTTSADYWKTASNFFSTTSANAWEATQWRWSTTSSDYWETVQFRWATTSTDYLLSASTTIPKTTLAISWDALQAFESGLISQASSTFTGFTQFAQASTTQLTNTGNTYLTALTSSLLSTNASGQVVATTSIGNSLLANGGALTVSAGSGLTGGGSVALGGTVTLTNPWDWNTLTTFGTTTNATTTPAWFLTGVFASSTSQLAYASSTALSVSGTGFFETATTSSFFGANLKTCESGNVLTWSAGLFGCEADDTGTSSAWPFTTGSYDGVLASATSSQMRFTGSPWSLAASSTFMTQASTTLFTNTGSTWLTASGLQGVLLGTDSTGQVVATTSVGTNYLTGTLGTINSTSFSVGGSVTITAASSTLLSDNNTFSGSTIFSSLFRTTSGLLSLASTTIGSGTQAGGLTISGGATTTGNAYFAGNVGIGTGDPVGLLDVVGSNPFVNIARTGTNQDATLDLFGDVAGTDVWTRLKSSSGSVGQVGTISNHDLIITTNDSEKLRVKASGNVGIGTTSPGTLLSLGNTGNDTINLSATATSTFGSGIDIRGGCFAINGECIGGGTDTVVTLSAIRVYTSTTQWEKPADFSYAVVEIWGGGGNGGDGITSGAGGTNSAGGGGGGGGGYTMKLFSASALTATTSVRATVASAGGTSNFGQMATSTGGSNGSNGSSQNGGAGGSGGTGSGGDINLQGSGGSPGGASGSEATGGSGGSAPRGGGGGKGGKIVPDAGAPFGGGGGGSSEGSNSGAAGAAGGIVVYEYTIGASGADIAENYSVSSPDIGPAEIVAFDTAMPITVQRAIRGEKRPLAGVISTKPGIVLGNEGSAAAGERPVALSGRVPLKFSYENGEVQIGDRITISSTPGVGMKAGPFDAFVGVVIAPVEQGENGDTVIVFLDLQPGLDIAALGDALLAPDNDNAPTTTASSSDTTTASSTPALAYLNAFVRQLVGKIAQWLADTANGIERIFARLIEGDTVRAKEQLCVGSVCVTEADFMATFGAAASAAANSPAPPTSEPAPSAQQSHQEQATTPESVPSSPSEIRDPQPPISGNSAIPDLMDIEQPDNLSAQDLSGEDANSTAAQPTSEDSLQAPQQTADVEAAANDSPPAEIASSTITPEPVTDNDMVADEPDITEPAPDSAPGDSAIPLPSL